MEPMIDSEVFERLIREKYKTQIAFAAAVGVSRQYISQIVKGERTPSLQKVAEFADKLGVSVDDLLGKEMALVA